MKLIKLKLSNKWIVVDSSNKDTSFSTIEEAASVLESNGVLSDEIDNAIIDMVATGNNAADFGLNGTFIYSATTE